MDHSPLLTESLHADITQFATKAPSSLSRAPRNLPFSSKPFVLLMYPTLGDERLPGCPFRVSGWDTKEDADQARGIEQAFANCVELLTAHSGCSRGNFFLVSENDSFTP